MSEKVFDSLKNSVIEAGKVLRGNTKPSREFIYEVDPSEIHSSLETWVVCVETDDQELLIPGKIYEIKIGKNRVWVTDEEGESALYPQDFFIPIHLPQKVSERLENIKQAA